MEIITDSGEMKRCDSNTINEYGVPSLVLMERAALGVVEEIRKRNLHRGRTLVLCGLGNNGGDGLAAARLLHLGGSRVQVLIPDDEERMSAETRRQYEILKRYGVPVCHTLESFGTEPFELVVDALFGIGLSRRIQGVFCQWLEYANGLAAFRLAVDLPSGINADDGQLMGCGFLADLTVTFAYRKIGHLLYPGSHYCGQTVVKDIGIGRESWLGVEPSCLAPSPEELKLLPRRPAWSNKGTFGKVLVIAGRKNMAGAALFAAHAALAAGSGLVKVMTPEENRVILQQQLPEAILETYDPAEGNRSITEKLALQLHWADVAVLGPGIGTDETARCLVEGVLRQGRIPLVLDADGLNICSVSPWLLLGHQGPVIVTPHLGEMARLTGWEIPRLRRELRQAALGFSKEYDLVCVLKDARTVTATPQGGCYINTSGNPGMATPGSGDVLTGVIAALLAQGLSVHLAAVLGVYLHGLSGDAMVLKTGQHGMLASDLIEGIRQVTAGAGREAAGRKSMVCGKDREDEQL